MGRLEWSVQIGAREATITLESDSAAPSKGLVEEQDDAMSETNSNVSSETVTVNPKWKEDLIVEIGKTLRVGPLRVRFKVKLGPPEGKWFAWIVIELNNWSTTRSQFEDRLIWADKTRDEYLEIYTVAGTAEIVWTGGWVSLRGHQSGGPRLKSDSIPDFSLPLLKKRQPGFFTTSYRSAADN